MVQLGRTPRDIYTDCSVTKATWEDPPLSREELNLSVPVNRSHVVLSEQQENHGSLAM